MVHAQPFNAECPICGDPVVAFPTTMMGTSLSGPMAAPRTREELVAACSTHGRSPYNDRTLVALGRKHPDSLVVPTSRSERRAVLGLAALYGVVLVLALVAVLLSRR